MKLESNLTLFPLSPYITLKNSDFDSDTDDIEIESIPVQSEDNNNINSDINVPESSAVNTNTMTTSTETIPVTTAASVNNSSSNNSTLNVSSCPTTTISTVAASIAALKSSSTSSTSSKSSLSRNEKRKLSLIKGSNIVKNIVKNFEEINNFYQNSLLKEAENINNTKLAKRNSSRKLEINSSDNNNIDDSDDNKGNDDNNDEFEIEHVSILEKEICQDPLEMDELNTLDDNNNDNNNMETAVVTRNTNNNNEKEKENENENEIGSSIENKMMDQNNEINNNEKINIINSEIPSNDYLDPPSFLKESDIATIRESNAILNSYFCDTNINLNNSNNNEGMTEIIKDISLEDNIEDSSSTNSEVSNAIFGGSVISVDDLDITRLTILLIENFIKLSDMEKEDFLNSEYFDLIKSHIMSIQDNEEIHFSSIFKDPKTLNEFESHIEALQQCVKERDDIINYYYQEIINERIQNEKLLNFCENEQLEREETNKIISGLSKKIEMEEDYISKLEVRCDMLMEKIRKYQTCCKHYEKSISLLSGNQSNAFKKLINSQNMDWKKNMSDLSESLSTSLLNGGHQSSVSSINVNNNSSFNAKLLSPTNFEDSTATSTISSSSATVTNEASGRPGIAHLINKLSTEKLSKNEEVQYLKSLLKSYNGKHIYINENVIKKQIIKKTASASQNIPATVDDVPVIAVSAINNNSKNNMNNSVPSSNKNINITSSKKMMMEKYLSDGQQYSNSREDTARDDDEINGDDKEKEEKNYSHYNNDYLMDDNDNDDDDDDDDEDNEDDMVNHSRSIDLSIIDDLNIFNEKHYQEKVLQHQSFIKSYEDDSFSDYSPTLVN